MNVTLTEPVASDEFDDNGDPVTVLDRGTVATAQPDEGGYTLTVDGETAHFTRIARYRFQVTE